MLVSIIFSHFQITCSPNSRGSNGRRLVDNDGSTTSGAPAIIVSLRLLSFVPSAPDSVYVFHRLAI
ncbi:hypothetical protein CGRA01v4_14687 [Colletotrichum graminicola]|nr:hypothetical protein CGRA01v4_14687 [Colletotrichum graminicola]